MSPSVITGISESRRILNSKSQPGYSFDPVLRYLARLSEENTEQGDVIKSLNIYNESEHRFSPSRGLEVSFPSHTPQISGTKSRCRNSLVLLTLHTKILSLGFASPTRSSKYFHCWSTIHSSQIASLMTARKSRLRKQSCDSEYIASGQLYVSRTWLPRYLCIYHRRFLVRW